MRIALFDKENWREIGSTLARNKTRTFLTAFGIFWGTALLAILWGGAHGFEGIMRRQFAGFSTNMAAVIPGRRTISYKGFNKGSAWRMTASDIDIIRRAAPAIEYSSIIVNRWDEIKHNNSTQSGSVIGIEADYNVVMDPTLYSGRLINNSDVAARSKVAVLGRNLANTFFGNNDPLGQYISIGGIYFKVIGVAGQKGEASIAGRIDDSVLTPYTTLQQVYNLGDDIGFFVMTPPSGHKPSENKTTIQRICAKAHSIHPDDQWATHFMDVSEEFEKVDNIFLAISLLALFIGSGSLLSGIIGVGNIMWIIVKERTHEFGVRRAIGAKPADITAQVLSESIVLTLIAGVAGVCFATAVLGIIDQATISDTLGKAGFQIPFATAVTIVALFFVFGSMAGTLPAIKAMRIKPIEALRDK